MDAQTRPQRLADLEDALDVNRLEKAGEDRGAPQLAWPFTAATKTSVTRRLLGARDDALARVGRCGPGLRDNERASSGSTHSKPIAFIERTSNRFPDTAL